VVGTDGVVELPAGHSPPPVVRREMFSEPADVREGSSPTEVPMFSRRKRMSDRSTSTGKVVVNRSMSLDGFIAGPNHTMDWGGDGRPLADFVDPVDLREIAAATGAMLIGRRTHEVGKRMAAEE